MKHTLSSQTAHNKRPQPKTTYFVSMEGNDLWSGNLAAPNRRGTDGPFATLERARDAVRKLKGQKSKGLKRPLTVMVMAGKYFLKEPFTLTAADSGTRDCPITYKGEKAVLSGGIKITGWKPYNGRILTAEVPKMLKESKWKFRQLFYNGVRQIRSRWPKYVPDNPDFDGWAYTEDAAENPSNSKFIYKPGAFRHKWAKPEQGVVNIYAFVGNLKDVVPIKSVDYKKRIITIDSNLMWDFNQYPFFWTPTFKPNNRFYVENLIEELDTPGEWCYDSEDGIIYFWPPDGKLKKDDEVIVPVAETLFTLNETQWVNISGFTFTETADGYNFTHFDSAELSIFYARPGWKYSSDAIYMRDASYCRIEKNHFDAVGGNAVYIESLSERNHVFGNEISNAGANGICAIGSKDRHPLFNVVSDNYIHHGSVMNTLTAGILFGRSDGNLISHNRIEHMPRYAITVGDNHHGRNVVEYNRIHDVCRTDCDNGAIMCWMEQAVKEHERCGHVIRYNYISDVYGCEVINGKVTRGSVVAPTSGIYIDNYASNCFIYGNILVRCQTAGIQNHGGKNNLIENNMFIGCGTTVIFTEGISWGLPSWAPMRGFMTGNHFMRNISYECHELFRLFAWSERAFARSDENLFYLKGGKKHSLGRCYKAFIVGDKIIEEEKVADEDKAKQIDTIEKYLKLGFEEHSLFGADPLFVNPKKDDYRLKPNSPALKLGFQPIDIDKIGPRKTGKGKKEWRR